jgi:hypothetical protein
MALITTVTKEQTNQNTTRLVRLSAMQLMCCTPCTVMIGMLDVAKAAAAHRLILCENSVNGHTQLAVNLQLRIFITGKIF